MAINEYDAPMAVQPQQTYVSQHVPLPFAELQGALNRKQQVYDVNEARQEELQDKFVKVQAMKKDKALRDKRINEYNERMDAKLASVDGDYGELTASIKSAGREFKTEMMQGRLGQIQKNYSGQVAYEKGLKDKLDNEKISQRRYNQLMNYSISEYEKVQEDIQADGQYNQFRGMDAANMVNVDDRVEELAKDYAADKIASKEWSMTSDGRYWRMDGGHRKEVKYSEIYNGVMGALERDEGLQADMNQKHMLEAYFDPTYDAASMKQADINGAVQRGASKYSYQDVNVEKDFKADAYGKMNAQYEQDHPFEEIIMQDELATVPSDLGKNEQEVYMGIATSKAAADATMLDILNTNLGAAGDTNSTDEVVKNEIKKANDLIAEYKKDRVGFKTRYDNGEIMLSHIDQDKLNSLDAILDGQMNKIARGQKLLSQAREVGNKALKGEGRAAVANQVKKAQKIYGKEFDFKGLKIPVSAMVTGDGEGWHIEKTGYSSLNPAIKIYKITDPSGKNVKPDPELTHALTTMRGQNRYSPLSAAQGLGDNLAKYNKAKAAYIDSRKSVDVSGTSSTGFPVYTYDAQGREVLDVKESGKATKLMNNFVGTNGQLNLANLQGLKAFTKGHDPEAFSHQLANVFGEDVIQNNLKVGAVRRSTSPSLGGQHYLTIAVSHQPKGGVLGREGVQTAQFRVPASELTSTSLDRMFNSPKARAHSYYHQAMHSGPGLYKPFAGIDLTINTRRDGTQGIIYEGTAYTAQEGLGYIEDYIRKGRRLRTAQGIIATDKAKATNATFPSMEAFKRATLEPGNFKDGQPITIYDVNTNEVKTYEWDTIEKYIQPKRQR